VCAANAVSDIDFNEMLVRDPLFSNPYAPDFMRQALGVDEHARIFGELEGEGVGEGCGYMYLRTRQNKGWAEQVRVRETERLGHFVWGEMPAMRPSIGRDVSVAHLCRIRQTWT
jgi:hypothetical protein